MREEDSAPRDLAAPPVDEALEASFKDIEIPPRPAILELVASEMRKREPDFRRLANAICADVGLAAGLLKTANSPYFGVRGRVRTVTQALVLLGLDTTSRALAGLILRKLFGASPAMERFWDASARIARASGWLAGELGSGGTVPAEDAYTFGLFRDCGIPILMRRFPDYAAVLSTANAEGEKPFTAAEKERYRTDHAMVGCLLAQSWWLPEETCLAVRGHHDALALRGGSGGMPAASARMVAIAQLAEHFVQQQTGLSRTREWDKLGVACLEILQLEAGDAERLAEDVGAAISEAI